MNETMVLPAIVNPLNDQNYADLEDELFPPAPYAPPSKPKPRRNWLFLSGIAAALVCAVGFTAYVMVALKQPNPAISVARTSLPEATTLPVKLPPPVATLEVASSPVWATDYTPPADGNFEAGRSLSLVTGAVQFRLQGGGRLVVEGPANLEFVSATRLVLHRGKLVALVPGGGLVVVCPTGAVTDLGTEFGVEVHVGGGTEVAVFQGSVAATISNTSSTQNSEPTLLRGGQAAIISDKKIDLQPEGAIKQRYLCNLENEHVASLDVTDLVSGGDGTTHRRGIAVDSMTGAIGDLPPHGNRYGDGTYHRILGYPVLDGTFIPDGTIDQMIVDSAGDRCKFITATKETHNLIETGGRIRWNDDAGISTSLGGVDYSTPGHGIICTHCNNALTFDLDAVRRLYPDRRITSFRCQVGNSYINHWRGAQKTNPLTGAFVLINGKPRFSQPRFSNQDGPFSVNLPLAASDRFLTLAATDANTDIDQDWVLWVDAQLDLAAK
jgi:hypothetical protein